MHSKRVKQNIKMAMLAEPRRKQRIGPNPRGKFFIEDEDNRGRQMLVKMGWKTGNGLGVQSQGMSEPIKPKIQMDAKGLGFDKKTDPWVAHNDEFEELLKALNSSAGAEGQGPVTTNSNSEDDSNEGLEKKSKVSRSRIHYHKFVKNKDLSRASSKDMSCIFGKSLNTVENTCLANTEDEPTVKESEQSTTVTSDEMVDVDTELLPDLSCKKKKKKKKKRNKEDREDDELTEGTVLTTPEGVSEATLQLVNEVDAAEEVVTETEHIRKKKKRKHKYHDDETPNAVSIHEAKSSINEPEDETLDNVDDGKNEEKRKKKKSKKKRKRDTEEVEMEAEVPVADCTAEEPVKKKKKRKRTDEDYESKEPVNTPSEEPAAHPPQQQLPPKVESFGSMQFINCGSIEDYFKNKKLQMLRRQLENRNNEQNSTSTF